MITFSFQNCFVLRLFQWGGTTCQSFRFLSLTIQPWEHFKDFEKHPLVKEQRFLQNRPAYTGSGKNTFYHKQHYNTKKTRTTTVLKTSYFPSIYQFMKIVCEKVSKSCLNTDVFSHKSYFQGRELEGQSSNLKI